MTKTTLADWRMISFVIPAMNEEATIETLFNGIHEQVQALGKSFEIIFIDDGSSDGTWAAMTALTEKYPRNVRALRFRSNSGKANALNAGFRLVRGDVVFTLDADLQDDPNEIPRFLEKLEEGFDIVSGWKRTRHDPWHKVLPSRVFNKMLSSLVGVKLHDHNCGFKCYRAEVVKDVDLYGEMHRMIPSLASIRGYKSSEIEVLHHARQFGVSKYGVKRFIRGFMDMNTVFFLKNFRERPLHAFANVTVVLTMLSVLLGGLCLVPHLPASLSTLCAVLAAVLFGVGLLLLGVGLVAELVTHNRTKSAVTFPIVEAIDKTGEAPVSSVSAEVASAGNIIALPNQQATRPQFLICDDDANIRRLMQYHVAAMGCAITEAEDGGQTLEKFSPQFNVVLLDLSMPIHDGMHCLSQILNRAPATKVIMVSAHGQINDAVRAMKLGAFDYIVKPFDPGKLTAVVQLALTMQELSATHRGVAA